MVDNRLRTGILETAAAIGADPLDLATAISYETAGTFDPTKRGPRTQWGQHRGLIQFGEPQAQKYGVDWNDPVGSQLGPNGAIAKYFQSSGFKPGMSGMDLYSTINAGAPGRYGASDANNGGAPGDVRAKWEQQMGGHREKAAALLGGDMSIAGMYGGGKTTPMASNPLAAQAMAMMPGGAPGGAPAGPGAAAEPAGMLLGNLASAFLQNQQSRQQQRQDEQEAEQIRRAALLGGGGVAGLYG